MNQENFINQDGGLHNNTNNVFNPNNTARIKELEEKFEKVKSVDTSAEKIKDGYRTASSLGKELGPNPNTIKVIVKDIIEKDQTLKNEVQEKVRVGSGEPDAYSPKLVELIKEKLGEPGEDTKEGYRTAGSLGKELKSNTDTIESIIKKLIEENQTLKNEVQEKVRVAKSKDGGTNAYSPKLVELIKEKLGEGIKEGYRTATSLQKELKADRNTIKSIVDELVEKDPTLEIDIQRDTKSRAGKTPEAYSPKLVELIKEELGEGIKEGYRTASSLRKKMKANIKTLESTIDELVKKDPTLKNEIQKKARDIGRATNAYSPKLVELIKEELGEGIKEGYRTANSLVKELKSSTDTIESIVKGLTEENQTLKNEVQEKVRVAKSKDVGTEAYSPKLVELIKEELGDSVKEGYRTSGFLKKELKSHVNTLKSIVKEIVKKDPTIENEIQRKVRNGSKEADAYSQKLVELIKKELEKMPSAILYTDRGYVLEYSLEILLRIINSSNLLVQSLVKLEGKKGYIKPDLVFEYKNKQKVIILDIKLQTTTGSIEKNKSDYSKIIKEKYPLGGNIVFLCLNGPEFQKEESEIDDKIKVRYYHILDFLERLIDNKRNKFLMKLISSNEDEDISEIPDLSKDQINKIKEIIERLRVFQKVVSENIYSTKDISHEQATEETHEMMSKLGKIKKETYEEIMSADFKEIMDF